MKPLLPRISIVIPSFNQGHFIGQTISSLLDQQYPDLELIIIDGGSTDNTIEVIKSYDVHIAYWVSEKDRGQSHAINKGLERCTGELFNWINSDDFSEPGALHLVADEYVRQPFIALCGKVNVWDTFTFSHIRDTSYIGLSSEDTIANYNINQEGTYWAMKAFRELEGVNESLHYVMDLDFWLRAHCRYPLSSFRKVDAILSNFRRHEGAKSTVNKKMGLFASKFEEETAVLFDQFLPASHVGRSYAGMLPIGKATHVTPAGNTLTDRQKQIITGLYMYKLINRFFQLGLYRESRMLMRHISGIEPEERRSDLRYLRRKLFLKGYIF